MDFTLVERRDLRARAARDRLSQLLRIEPGELRSIGAEEAEAMIAVVAAERLANGERP